MTSGSELWVVVLAGAILVGVLFLIPVLLELRRAVRSLTAILKITEESLTPTLRDLRSTLANLDRITADVSTVTDDVRVFTGSIRQVGKDIEELSGLVSVLGGGIGTKIAALRAGIVTGVVYLVKNLFHKGGRS
jgi:uncharacterized protein YoxC